MKTSKNYSYSIKNYFLSARVWTLPLTLFAGFIGSALAYKSLPDGKPMDWVVFIQVLVMDAILCFMTNQINSYYDYIYQIDNHNSAGDRTMFDFGLKPQEVRDYYRFSIVAYNILVGLLYFRIPDPTTYFLIIVPMFLISEFFIIYYTMPPISFKYRAMGEFCILFGLVTFVPMSYFPQTLKLDWIMVLYSVPVTLAMECVLHTNNTRDIESDRKSGIKTFAMILGSLYS
eukprot:gene3217-4029_t